MLVLFSLVFFRQVGNGMVWSVIALFGQSLGASAAMIGLMISAYGGTRLVVNMPAGYLSEKVGRREMMIAGSVILAAASLSVYFVHSVEGFLICLMAMGAASSTFMASALAAVADLGTPGQRLRDASYYQAANIIGTGMGPALGGIAAGLWGYSSPYMINGLFGVAAVVAFGLMAWPQATQKRKLVKSEKGSLKAFARSGATSGLMYFAIFYVRVASNWVLLPLIAQSKFGLEPTTIGLILTGGAAANLSMITMTQRLARLIGRVWVIVVSSGLCMSACLLLAFTEQAWMLLACSMLFGATAGLAAPTMIAYVADRAPEDQRGPAMGLLRTMQDLSLILGPLVTGLLSDNLGFGYRGGLLGCVALLAASTIVFRVDANARRASQALRG